MRFSELVDVSRSVAETSGRLEKIDRLASLLNRLEPEEIEIAVAFLSGSPRQGRIGVGASVVRTAHDAEPAASATLMLSDVDAATTVAAHRLEQARCSIDISRRWQHSPNGKETVMMGGVREAQALGVRDAVTCGSVC